MSKTKDKSDGSHVGLSDNDTEKPRLSEATTEIVVLCGLCWYNLGAELSLSYSVYCAQLMVCIYGSDVFRSMIFKGGWLAQWHHITVFLSAMFQVIKIR